MQRNANKFAGIFAPSGGTPGDGGKYTPLPFATLSLPCRYPGRYPAGGTLHFSGTRVRAAGVFRRRAAA